MTVAGTPRPAAAFFVLATQNPIEQEGTYPLPEAQLDRFFMQVNVDYLSLSCAGSGIDDQLAMLIV